MAGIFQSGAYFMGFDMDLTAAQIFTQTSGATMTSSVVPFSFGYSCECTGGINGILLNTNLTTLIVGARIYLSSLPSSSTAIYNWYDATGGAAQVTLRVNSTGQLQFYLGSGTGTPIGSASSAGTLSATTWAYVECLVTISATVGQVQCYVNGVQVITTAATQNTKSTSNTYTNAFQFNNVGPILYVDDWYMLDSTGSSPLNTYLGPVQVREEAPNANSAVTGGRNNFTPTNPTNVNHSNVANIPANSSEYNASSTVGNWDQFAYPALPSNVTTVFALNPLALLELDSSGARTVSLNCSAVSGGTPTDNLGAAFTPSAGTLTIYNEVCPLDPHGATWTPTNAGNAELGVKVVT